MRYPVISLTALNFNILLNNLQALIKKHGANATLGDLTRNTQKAA